MNSTRHDIFYILYRYARQDKKRHSAISIDDLIKLLAWRFGTHIKRRQTFYHIRGIIAGGYITRESNYIRWPPGWPWLGPSSYTITPAGRYYLQNMGVIPGRLR